MGWIVSGWPGLAWRAEKGVHLSGIKVHSLCEIDCNLTLALLAQSELSTIIGPAAAMLLSEEMIGCQAARYTLGCPQSGEKPGYVHANFSW